MDEEFPTLVGSRFVAISTVRHGLGYGRVASVCLYVRAKDNGYVGVDDRDSVIFSFVVRAGDPENLLPSVSEPLAAERRKQEIAEQQRAAEADRQKAADDAAKVAEDKRIAVAALEKASEERRAASREAKKAAEARAATDQAARKSAEADRAKTAPSSQSAARLSDLPKTENSSAWPPLERFVPLQEWQFCEVIKKFRADLGVALSTRNEIQQDLLYRQRQEDLSSLIPNGEFQNWVVRVLEVTLAPDGSAAVFLQLPCTVAIGSNRCDVHSHVRGTVPEDSPLYRELAKMDTVRDYVMVNAAFLAIEEPKKGSLPSYKSFPAGSYCVRKVDADRQEELFSVQLKSIFKVRQPPNE